MGAVRPAQSHLREQTEAFCRAGAQSIIAFTWRNFSPLGSQKELSNDATLRAGLVEGHARLPIHLESWGLKVCALAGGRRGATVGISRSER